MKHQARKRLALASIATGAPAVASAPKAAMDHAATAAIGTRPAGDRAPRGRPA